MNSDLKGRHTCGVKKKINTTSSTEQELDGWEHKIPEKMDVKDAFEYNHLPMAKDPNDCVMVKTSHKKAKDNRPLIDLSADELKRPNFYNQSILPKKYNIMEGKEARDFRRAVSQRAHNVWVNLEINRMIRFQHNNLKTWVREDKDVRCYVDNPGYGGPKWDDVKIKQTFDALTGYMIEYKVVHPGENQYLRRLPLGVTHIKTIFRYEDTGNRRKGKHPNKISHNKKNKRKKKGKKKSMRKIVKEECKDHNIPMEG